MIPRSLWFVAGAGAGVYAVVRARRVAEALTADGIKDRINGLGVGWRMFADEMRTESHQREIELRERFGLPTHYVPELTSGAAARDDSRKREIN